MLVLTSLLVSAFVLSGVTLGLTTSRGQSGGWDDSYEVIPPDNHEDGPKVPTEVTLGYFKSANHVFKAINDTVTLSLIIEPVDAYNKSVTWKSSDSSKVSLVVINNVTAQIKCLQNYNGTITITATATQGTAYTGDDVSAYCYVTYNHPLNNISLNLYNYGTIPAMNANAFLVEDVKDIIDFDNYYGFKVTLDPQFPTQNKFNFINANLDIHDYTSIVNLDSFANTLTTSGFKFTKVTPAEEEITVTVESLDETHSASLSITIGQHLGVKGTNFNGKVTLLGLDKQTQLEKFESIHDYILDQDYFNYAWFVGTYFKLELNAITWVNPEYEIRFDSSFLSIADASPNLTVTPNGVKLKEGANGASFITLKMLQKVNNVALRIVPLQYQDDKILTLNFKILQPVTSLAINPPTVEF